MASSGNPLARGASALRELLFPSVTFMGPEQVTA